MGKLLVVLAAALFIAAIVVLVIALRRPRQPKQSSWQGGGRSSARETIGRVAAGAIAKKILRERFGVEVLAYVKQVQRLIATVDADAVKMRDIEANIVRCPDPRGNRPTGESARRANRAVP